MKYLIPVFVLIAGLLFTSVGLFKGYQKYAFFKSPIEKVEGTVVDFFYSNKGSVAPIIAYTTKNGTPLQYTSSLYTSPPRYQKGEKVMVYYKIGYATEATLDSFWENWHFFIGFTSIGLLAFSGGVYLFKKTLEYVEPQENEVAVDF